MERKLSYYSLVSALLLALSSNSAIGQTPTTIKPLFKSPVPVSPQSASLIKSIDYPVDYARGLVNISIPLYTVKVNDIEIPIALKYHSSGVKVHDMSGWVGLGWSLTAEPSITRSIQGIADERSFLRNELLGSNLKEHLELQANGVNDELPDQFYYLFLGKSGSFFFSRKPGITGSTIKTLPFQPLKISQLSLNPNQLTEFKIVDDKGRQCYFGGTKIEKTDLLDFTTWKGTKIISSNLLDTVYFDYHPVKNEMVSKPQSHYAAVDDQAYGTYDEMLDGPACTGGSIQAPDEQLPKPFVMKSVNGTVYKYFYDNNQQQLVLYRTGDGPNIPEVVTTEVLYTKEIKFRGGKVVFEIGFRTPPQGISIRENAWRLNKIVVYNDNGAVIKDISLHYQEYTSIGTLPLNPNEYVYESRMLLNDVQIIADSQALPEKYEFTYNNIGVSLPNRFTYDMDAWGYYNGPKQNKSLIPVTTIEARTKTGGYVDLILGDADRKSVEYYMQAGILTKIKYPTGGTSAFVYEANRAYNYQTSSSEVVGGLRIRSITDFDPLNYNEKTRTFKYGINENGSGNMRHWIGGGGLYNPYIIQQIKIARVRVLAFCGSGFNYTLPTDITSRYRTLMSSPVADIFYNGETVAYPEVTEYNGSHLPGRNNGKTVYAFRFSGMGSGGGYETPYFVPGTNLPYDKKVDWSYGTPLQTNTFKGNALYSKLSSNGYNYLSLYHLDKIWSRSIFKTTMGVGDFNYGYPTLLDLQRFQTQVNEYETGYAQLLSDTVKTYDEFGNATVKINAYNYGNNNIVDPTETSTLNSEGISKKNKVLFAHEMVASGQTEPYEEMISRNMISIPVKEETYANNVFQSSKITNFSRNWITTPWLVLPQTIKTKYKSENEETRVEFHSYDKYGNPLEVSLDGGVKKSYIWGYNRQYPIAEIVNADYAGIVNLLGGTEVVSAFIAGNPTESATLSFLSPLRNPSYFPGAQITTYTYKPLVGMTSQTDVKGMTTYYEYDSFQRLKHIKDQDHNIIKSYDYHYKP